MVKKLESGFQLEGSAAALYEAHKVPSLFAPLADATIDAVASLLSTQVFFSFLVEWTELSFFYSKFMHLPKFFAVFVLTLHLTERTDLRLLM